MTPGDVTARVLVDLPTSARRTARGFPVVPIHTTHTSVIDAHTPHITRFLRVLASPSRSSSRSARAIVARLGETTRSRRIHPCPLASLPRHGSLARAFHRRDALARVRSDASREQSPVHLARARRFPRVIVTLVRTRWMNDSRARDRTRSNANA
jgi:hypothetical protein